MGCLHDPANVQQTSSKYIQNTRANAGRLLDRVNTLLLFVRSSGFPCCRPDDMELTADTSAWSCWLHHFCLGQLLNTFFFSECNVCTMQRARSFLALMCYLYYIWELRPPITSKRHDVWRRNFACRPVSYVASYTWARWDVAEVSFLSKKLHIF